jgi:hypothetical protein
MPCRRKSLERSTSPVEPYLQKSMLDLADDSTSNISTYAIDVLDLAEDNKITFPAYVSRERSAEMVVSDSHAPQMPCRRRSIETPGDSTAASKPCRRRSIERMPGDSTAPVKPHRHQSIQSIDLDDNSTSTIPTYVTDMLDLADESTSSIPTFAMDILDLLAEDSTSTSLAYLPAFLDRQGSVEILVADSPVFPMPCQRRSIETSQDSNAAAIPFRRRPIELHVDTTAPAKPYRHDSIDSADDSTSPVMPCQDSIESTVPCSWTTTEVQESSDNRDDLHFL